MYSNDYYLNLFNTDQNIINKILFSTLSSNKIYSDIFFQLSNSQTIALEDNIVSKAYSSVDSGIGIRVVNNDKTGYSFTESPDLKLILEAAKTASSIADKNSSNTVKSVKIKNGKKGNFYPSEMLWENVDINKKIKFLTKLNDAIYNIDKKVINVQISFSHESSYKLIATSDGIIIGDFQPLFSIRITCTAEVKNHRETNRYAFSGRFGGEYLSQLNIDKIAAETVRRTLLLFNSVRPNQGEQEVVLAAGSSGILLHESIGHGLEADFNRKNISIFSNKLNKKVANPFVTIVDDGTLPNSRGSINVDDEGVKTQKTTLVENGILTGFMHDKISANFFSTSPTGNGRRESFRYPPIPRMRTTYMLPGPHNKDEIIRSINKGILAESFTNGQVLIGAGDFTFYVKSGYLIEDGKITRPIKDVNLIGNGPDVLSKITMVADDLEIDNSTWTCGKDGQDVPVSLGHPTIKVSSITVGSAE